MIMVVVAGVDVTMMMMMMMIEMLAKMMILRVYKTQYDKEGTGRKRDDGSRVTI